MLQGLEDTSEWSKYIAHYSTQALLEIIWHVIHEKSESNHTKHSYFLGRSIKEYIDEHYCEPLTMHQICTDLKLSESYVSHAFKDMLGYSPMQYVMRRKIGEAQTLLISTDYSITKIAQTVGYDSPSHFNQRFLKYVGISPQ